MASLGWKWIFWINIPLLVNAFFWTRNIPNVEDVRSEFRERLDYLGIVIFCLAIILLLYGLLGTDMHRVLTGILASGLLFFVLHRHEKHVEVAPFIDFGFISSHRTVAYIYVRTIIVNVAFYTVFYGIPQWAEADKNMGASLAGPIGEFCGGSHNYKICGQQSHILGGGTIARAWGRALSCECIGCGNCVSCK